MNSMGQERKLVIVGGTFSDAHVVSIYLVSLFLQEHGYDVINLSCCSRTEDFFAAIPSDCTPLAIVIANQNGCALADLQDLPRLRRIYKVTSPIVLGGHYYVGCGPSDAIDKKLYELGVDYTMGSQEELLAFLSRLPSRPTEERTDSSRELPLER